MLKKKPMLDFKSLSLRFDKVSKISKLDYLRILYPWFMKVPNVVVWVHVQIIDSLLYEVKEQPLYDHFKSLAYIYKHKGGLIFYFVSIEN